MDRPRCVVCRIGVSTFCSRFVGNASFALIVAVLPLVAMSQIIELRQNGSSEGDRNAGDISWINTESVIEHAILLQANGALGRTGTAGKVDSGNGGQVIARNESDAIIELVQGGNLKIEANGANFELGPSTFNLSARPGAAGSITFSNEGRIEVPRWEGELHNPGGLIRLYANAGDQASDHNRNADDYYQGKPGGSITIEVAGQIKVPADRGGLDGIYAESKGGRGYEHSSDQPSETGNGGPITLIMTGGSINTGSTALDLLSIGGGEVRDSGDQDYRPGGDGGQVTLELRNSTVTTALDDAYGVHVRSWGGENFVTKKANSILVFSTRSGEWFGGPRDGSLGGRGGDNHVFISTKSLVETQGANAPGVLVDSSGGVGGYGDDHWSLVVAKAGDSGSSGGGGNIKINNEGKIETSGDGSHGMLVGSVGGGRFESLLNGTAASLDRETAGDGVGWAVVNTGGGGGAGGNGGVIDIAHKGMIETRGDGSLGIYAASVGGGGGAGGGVLNLGAGAVLAVVPTVTLGGAGGGGGNGGEIRLNHSSGNPAINSLALGGTVTTHGLRSPAIALYSIGGGGGLAGDTKNLSVALPSYSSIQLSVNIGGAGGAGGSGGEILANNVNTIKTHASSSPGINIASIGGGGGNGGLAQSMMFDFLSNLGVDPGAAGLSFGSGSLNISIGGEGGKGGSGGSITAANKALIQTSGDASVGAKFSSIGGGGAVGGNSVTMNMFLNFPNIFNVKGQRVNLRANIAVGGVGGDGGDGGRISASNSARIETGVSETGSGGLGDYSAALEAVSIGGGGGDGGMAATYSADLYNIFIAGYSESLDKAYNSATETESGVSTQGTIDISVGGSGGSGGSGGAIDLTNDERGILITHGANAPGVKATSVGGGGGTGMFPLGTQNVTGHKANIVIGGSGGGDKGTPLGDGGRVVVLNAGEIATYGDGSPAIFAQSAGGGGGSAGDSNINQKDFEALQTAKLVASEAEAWKGFVNAARGLSKSKETSSLPVADEPAVPAFDEDDDGFVLVGANDAAGADKNKIADPKQKSPISSVAVSFAFGGKGGAGGDGGAVEIDSTGRLQTKGALSPAIYGQSIGGGGGNGGAGVVGGGAVKLGTKEVNKIKPGNVAEVWKLFAKPSLNMAFGGSGGSKGDGGSVTTNVSSMIETFGRASAGIFMQSVGGGGGSGGGAIDNSAGFMRFNMRVAGAGGAGGHGGRVLVTAGQGGQDGVEIKTNGESSAAIKLLSIGGGGGQTNVLEAIDPFNGLEQYKPPKFADEDRFALTVETMAMTDNTVIESVALGGWYKDIATWRNIAAKGISGDVWGAAQGVWKEGDKTAPAAVLSVGLDLDGKGSAGGNGGAIDVNLSRSVLQTEANYSPAMEMYSIGGGGLVATVAGRDTKGNVAGASLSEWVDDGLLRVLGIQPQTFGDGGDGGEVSVSLNATSIETRGVRSHGILAKSIGGGGGHYGETDLLVYNPPDEGAGMPKGDGGRIMINAQGNNSIQTRGSYAHGIFVVSAGGGFGTVALDNEIVVLDTATKQGKAGDIEVTYEGSIESAGRDAVGVLAVSAGRSDQNALIDLDLKSATVLATGASQPIGLIGQAARYEIGLTSETTVQAEDGYAIATMVSGTFAKELTQDYFWNDPKLRASTLINEVVVAGGSTLSGDVLLTGPSRLIFRESSHWNPGTYSVIGGVNELERIWDQPVKFMRDADGVMRAANSDVKFDQLGQVAFLSGSTLNPGGEGQFTTSEIHIGASGSAPGMLWLTEGSTLQMDIGHRNGQVVHDKLLVNPGSSQGGSIVSGAGDRGGYQVKIRLRGLQGLLGKELVLAQASRRIMPGELVQPLAVSAHSYGIEPMSSGGERMLYQVDSLRFDRQEMDGFARSIARQMDDQVHSGKFGLEPSMVAALGYYAGDEGAYEDQLAELAENGTVLDVANRRIQALGLQNNLHSCLVFVGEGLGLLEQNCSYARVTGSDLRLSGQSGDDSDQTVKGTQIALGGQRRIGQGMFAGILFGVGQSSSQSIDSEYQFSSQNIVLGAVIKKRFDEVYEVAVSGTYSHGWSSSNRFVNSSMAAPAYLSGSNKNNEAGLRLRLAYYGSSADAYIKPYVDFDARYYQSDEWTESGTSPFALRYPSISFWTYTATPQLEIGTRINTGSGVWRAYASGGVALSNDDKRTMLADFLGTSGGAPIEMQFDATPTMGIVKVGAEYVGKDNAFFSFSYEGMFGSGMRQQSITARVGLRF